MGYKLIRCSASMGQVWATAWFALDSQTRRISNQMVLCKTVTFTPTNSANCVVLCASFNTYRVNNNTTCCLLVCSEWPPVANPATPISHWMMYCTACTCRTTHLTLLRPASVHSMLSIMWRHLHTRPVLTLLTSIHDVLRPCITSMLLAFPCERCRAASRPL